MVRLKNWSFKCFVKFLKDYEFELGHVQGSHYFYNGRIEGQARSVKAIHSKKEKESQSNKTMEIAVRNSGIPKKYFEEWKSRGIIHKEIIY
jgi:predicted RNA binding protein YcfA (HicA-like mRNA interferase family)